MAFKNPNEQADHIIDLDNKTLDLTNEIDAFFDKFPKVENETYEDFDSRVYPEFENQYGYLESGTLNDIYTRALENAWKRRQ